MAAPVRDREADRNVGGVSELLQVHSFQPGIRQALALMQIEILDLSKNECEYFGRMLCLDVVQGSSLYGFQEEGGPESLFQITYLS